MMTTNNKFRPIFIASLNAGLPATSVLRTEVVAHMF